jgi:choline dehydrogenase
VKRRDHYDVVIVGGGSAGSALATGSPADPGTTVLVLEAGRTDTRLDPFIHMPAALPFPIGSPLYDWRYASEPEPHMNVGASTTRAARVLGGSSSINGNDLPARQPAGLRALGGRSRMESWDYAHCLPYFKRMETCTAGADAWPAAPAARAGARPGLLPAVRGVLRGRAAGRHPLTDDVNGYRRRGSPSSTATCTGAAGSGAQRLPAPGCTART